MDQIAAKKEREQKIKSDLLDFEKKRIDVQLTKEFQEEEFEKIKR